MNFRYDINGLRAIAVIAVVIFHFNPAWLPGGFAGVDVFFVISGFLMTSIICRGLEKDTFNTWQFYMARANRIIPALALVCVVLLLFGWFYLLPEEYATLGKHVGGSVSFLSNLVYWQEAGYFDASSHEKWLLHSWSLSVEWQFYLIYPLILVAAGKAFGVNRLKWLVLALTAIGFLYSALTSALWPSASYYMLPSRAWELMFGGLAYLFPVVLTGSKQRFANAAGILLIVVSYILVSEGNPWPGYLAFFPVLGSYLIILAATQNSLFTNNVAFQALGRWSYSIYLWHWPVVVFGYRYEIPYWWIPGLFLSVFMGFLSYRYIENIKWRRVSGVLDTWRSKPSWMAALAMIMGGTIIVQNGILGRFSEPVQVMIKSADFSPLRDKCHLHEYQDPSQACEYFDDNVTWAVFGDSHTVELAYALAQRLQPAGIGIKHYSFSGCAPQRLDQKGHSKCTKWYKDAMQNILDDDRIQTVLINHRYSWALYGDHTAAYPALPDQNKPDRTERMLGSLDQVVNTLADAKQHVYVMTPVPEIGKSPPAIIAYHYATGDVPQTLTGASREYYQQRNKAMLAHFEQVQYPDNVTVINTSQAFCDDKACYAVDKGKSLYFDNNHPSLEGSRRILELFPDAAFSAPMSPP